jgi:hypothetical protein
VSTNFSKQLRFHCLNAPYRKKLGTISQIQNFSTNDSPVAKNSMESRAAVKQSHSGTLSTPKQLIQAVTNATAEQPAVDLHEAAAIQFDQSGRLPHADFEASHAPIRQSACQTAGQNRTDYSLDSASEAPCSKISRRVQNATLANEAKIYVGCAASSGDSNVHFAKVKFSEKANGLQSTPGQPGVFFSIHSTAKHPTEHYYDLSGISSKSCFCCAHTVATLRERWNPFKPGAIIYLIRKAKWISHFITQASYILPAILLQQPVFCQNLPEKSIF